MNVLRLHRYFLEATGLTVHEFLEQQASDPKFYCNPQLQYCKDRGYKVHEHITFDAVSNCYEVSYSFEMSPEEMILFLIAHPDEVNTVS